MKIKKLFIEGLLHFADLPLYPANKVEKHSYKFSDWKNYKFSYIAV